MAKIRHELEAEDGYLTLVTRTYLGHVAEVDPEKIPAEVWDDFSAEVEADNDAQRAAAGYEEAARAAFVERFGTLGGRLTK